MTAYDVYFTRTITGVKQIHAANKTQAEELFYTQAAYLEQHSRDKLVLEVVPAGAPRKVEK